MSSPRAHVYCTYFDANYLHRGLALWRSLRAVSPTMALRVCCLDDTTQRVLDELALPGVVLFSIAEVERRFPDLAAVKGTRGRIDYYFTATPSVISYLLDTVPGLDEVTYLDADLYFYADPEPLFAEMAAAGGSIGIIAHRFPARIKSLETYGIYNVGWLTFRRDPRGLACLEDWRRNCIAWCHVRTEDGRFGDQKYLDDWPARFDGVVVLSHPGGNVALWNLERSTVEAREGTILIDGQPLLFYHFHALKPVRPWLFRTSAASEYDLSLSRGARRLVYAPYLRAWREMAAVAAAHAAAPRPSAAPVTAARSPLRRIRGMLRQARGVVDDLRRAGRGEFLLAGPPSRTAVARAVAIVPHDASQRDASPSAFADGARTG